MLGQIAECDEAWYYKPFMVRLSAATMPSMACFEGDLRTLISGGDHVVQALYWSYL